VDETIRHAVTKLANIHFVANEEARSRLLQLGEEEARIFLIGSPEVDVMSSPDLPSFNSLVDRYELPFEQYAVLAFHPVTTEYFSIATQAKVVVDFVLSSGLNWLVILPNNDDGAHFIHEEYERLVGDGRFRVLPSMRFEYYLSALKHSQLILGNSSSGVREASFFGVPAVNLGSRQANRVRSSMVLNCGFDQNEIEQCTDAAIRIKRTASTMFGDGKSAERFGRIFQSNEIWSTPVQKAFVDRPSSTRP
jgi:UDP-N-acetylglucosamine 2-epimerase (hydrolysing)